MYCLYTHLLICFDSCNACPLYILKYCAENINEADDTQHLLNTCIPWILEFPCGSASGYLSFHTTFLVFFLVPYDLEKYILFLGNFMHFCGFKYHQYISDFQMYIPYLNLLFGSPDMYFQGNLTDIKLIVSETVFWILPFFGSAALRVCNLSSIPPASARNLRVIFDSFYFFTTLHPNSNLSSSAVSSPSKHYLKIFHFSLSLLPSHLSCLD